jgi:hypothetical protein
MFAKRMMNTKEIRKMVFATNEVRFIDLAERQSFQMPKCYSVLMVKTMAFFGERSRLGTESVSTPWILND